MRSLYRFLLADCLRAGVTWSPRTHYRGLVWTDGHLSIVRLQEKTVAAKFVVGADGARSHVAADLGLSSNRRFIFGVENVYESAILAEPPTMHCVLDPAIAPAYLAWVVHDGHEVHVGTAGDPKRFRAGAALKRFEAEAAGWVDLRAARLQERRGGWIPVNGVLPHIACNQGLLVGDAAGAPSPLTGGGLDPCIRLSEFAAGIIADSLAAGSKPPLAAYSGRRFTARSLARGCMRAALDLAGPQMLELACAMMHVPGPRKFAEHVFFARCSFPDAIDTTVKIPQCALKPNLKW